MSLARFHAQSVIAGGICTLTALAALAAVRGTGAAVTPLTLLTTVVLAAGLLLAYRYPLPLQRYTIVHVTGIPLYLAAVLLSPPLAALAVAAGTFVGELTACTRCANPLSHVLTHTGRWTLTALLASLTAHLVLPGWPGVALPLLATGAVLWLGDFLTVLLVLVPLTQVRPIPLFVSLVRQAGTTEGIQYVMGLLASLATLHALWALPLLSLPMVLIYTTLKRGQDRQEEQRQFLESMADAVDLRDPYTGGHSRRVAELTDAILGELGQIGPAAELIVAAARVHDIGKIGVPDQILRKPGPLTQSEKAIMETHAEQGAQLLLRYRDFQSGVAIVRHHHEAWDGSGYPAGLAGAEIPFGSRVIAVADSFDAMTSHRPYRAGMTLDRAVDILSEGRAKQWDAQIVDAFLRALAAGRVEIPEPADTSHLERDVATA